MTLDARSARNLAGVHPDLRAIIERAADHAPGQFVVTEGVRSLERQRMLYHTGSSKTMKSRHLTGHAVDIAAVRGGKVIWDSPEYARLAVIVKAAAVEVGIPVEWGGDWKTFVDGVHYQLPWSKYP